MSLRLGSIKPKEFIRKMKRGGFVIDHQTGSHVILINSEKIRLSVPYHTKEMKRGLLFGLIKQANLTVEEFQQL